MFDPMSDINSAFADLPFLDPEFPPSLPSTCPVIVESGGTTVFGDLILAGGRGAKGTVILTPPMGDGDGLEGLIVPLTYAGIHVLQFFPRGTSREGEPYSLPQTVDDVHAMVGWIVANSGADKANMAGQPLGLDPSRVALCGLGFGGGNVSLAACAESRVANYAIPVAPGNVEAQTTTNYLNQIRSRYCAIKEATSGEVDPEAWLGTLTSADKKRLDIDAQAPKLVDKHVLMIGAKQDAISPLGLCHEPAVNALRKMGAKHLTDVVFDTDHMFLTTRYSLARQIISWLRTEGGF